MMRPGRVLCNAHLGTLAMRRPGLKGVLDPTQERPMTNSTVKAPPHGRLFSRIGLQTRVVAKLEIASSPTLLKVHRSKCQESELLVKVTGNWVVRTLIFAL